MHTPDSNETKSNLNAWRSELLQQQARLKSQGLLRHLIEITDGSVDFSSNDYLSLNESGSLLGIWQESVDHWHDRIGSTGSRLVAGQHFAFDQAEFDFVQWTGHESALLFHSGYAANVGTISTIAGPGDLMLCDRLVHASILDGVRLSGADKRFFQHNDLNHLEATLQKVQTSRKKKGKLWVVTEALFSLDGDSPDLLPLVELCERYGALLYLDEAHSIGLYGPGGRGLAVENGVMERIAVSVYPMGKAPGFMGAFVCGMAELRDTLIQRARSFVFSTAQPPILAHTLSGIVHYLQTEEADFLRRRAFENSKLFRHALARQGMEVAGISPIVPVIVGDAQSALDWMERCRQAKFDVRAIRPPSVPPGSSRLRVSIHSGHTGTQLNALAELLGAMGK